MGSFKSDLKHNSLYDRVNKLLVSYDWSDCSFLVCGQELKAHKLILAISSPVFEAMFYGPLSTNKSIIISDIDPNIFQLLLNFIYTDKVDILTIEEAYDLLYASKKYLLDTLTEICLEYIKTNTRIDNVIYILNQPDYLQDNELLTCALKLFCQHAYHLLQEHKEDISISSWKKILEADEINIKEKDLIKIVFAWSTSYSKKYKFHTDTTDRRDILIKTGLFSLLRFSALSIEDLDDIVKDELNLLLPDEILTIKHMLTKTLFSDKRIKFEDKINTITVPRKSIEVQSHLCHRALIRSESPITIDSHNYCIQSKIKADKTFFIHSLKIQSRMAPVNNLYSTSNIYNEDFVISVLSEDDNSIIKEFDFKEDTEYDCCIDIEFLEPLCIRRDQWTRISFIWQNLTLYDTHMYSVQSRDLSYTMLYNKIKFEFQDISSYSNTSGSFLKGFKFCM
ncbi:unnamed protein product [Pieris brassicae]|uniref:BTB domain-containing protein n=1 Tax=Pieris brassicae TaxID=7116 RepID=A0A9P0X5Y7_PIEBR|nr:unnamed protein product [Pieris brassicae]